jgi:prophage regulatory protein
MTADIAVPPLYIELDKLEKLTTLSASTIQGMVARNEFPAPRELSSRRVAWLYREVMEWAENRPISSILPPPNTGAKKPRRATASPASPGNSTAA